MHPLTEPEIHALRNLLRKKQGEQVPFLNIRDAQVLTELGFAVRSREGWDITPAGLARLAQSPPEQTSSATMRALQSPLRSISRELGETDD